MCGHKSFVAGCMHKGFAGSQPMHNLMAVVAVIVLSIMFALRNFDEIHLELRMAEPALVHVFNSSLIHNASLCIR